jgi:hypothetical protein
MRRRREETVRWKGDEEKDERDSDMEKEMLRRGKQETVR